MSWNYHEVNPDGDYSPEEFKQGIQGFNDFLSMLSLEAESQTLESSKEKLEDLRDSIKDEVCVFNTGSFSIVFKEVEELSIYKLKGFEVVSIEVVDEGLKARIKKKREGEF